MGRKTRTYSTEALLKIKFKEFKKATPELKKMLGNFVEPSAVIYVYGNSGHGKSMFVNELYQELSKCVDKIYHNNVESGKSRILQLSAQKLTLGCQVIWADRHNHEEMVKSITTNRANVIGLDSLDKSRITYDEYLELEKICKKRSKILVIIGRATGKQHSTSVGERICFDADVKIFVNEGVAYINSRYGSVLPYVMQGVANHFAEQNALMKRIKKGELFSEMAQSKEDRLKD